MATDFSKKAAISSPLTIGNKKQNDMPLDIRTRIETLDEIELQKLIDSYVSNS